MLITTIIKTVNIYIYVNKFFLPTPDSAKVLLSSRNQSSWSKLTIKLEVYILS